MGPSVTILKRPVIYFKVSRKIKVMATTVKRLYDFYPVALSNKVYLKLTYLFSHKL